MRKPLRIFISSPGDVPEERLRAHLVVQKLARDYRRFFAIEPYLWEYEPMLASGHFQDAIEPPSRSDIVVLVVYSRLGTALPTETAQRAYRGIDGRAPVTGTEWEFEEALEANRRGGAPDLLAYRKLGDPQASLADPAKRAEQERQWDALEVFWRRHFEGGGVFLAGSAKFRTLEEFDAKLEADLVRLIESRIAAGLQELSGGGEEASWLGGSPYPGLSAFDFDDAPIFFGRDGPIREASTRLQAAAAGGTAFLLILGASGSGKSSLARAGLLPALFAAKAVPGVGLWRRVVLRPAEGGIDPVLGLAQALVAGDPARGEGLPELLAAGLGPEALAAHLAAAPDDPSFPFRTALGSVAAEARRSRGLLPHEEARLVLLLDQVEELFTRPIDPARRSLFVRILAGLSRSGVVWVVGTVRNDLWHRAAAIPELVEVVEAGARLDLPAPDGAEIVEMVRRPAVAAGVVFEKNPETGIGLDATVATAAAAEPGALPLLSVLLRSLFERDVVEGGGRALTFAGYRALGELKGAIAARAEAALTDLRARDPDAAAALPAVLRALVTAGADGTATSRPAPLDIFPAGSPELRLVETLLGPENRLLVASERDGVAEVRLAHEALIANWPAARDQVLTDRRDLQTRARLETLERRWADAASPGEKRTALLRGLNLAEGIDLARRWQVPAEAPLGRFVAQSRTADRWRRRRFGIAASVLLLIFAAIAALASLQWRRAEGQTAVARAAEETEREARAAADASRNEAERERDRAEGERTRALAALRTAKRSAARTLATQAELAVDRSEMRRAGALALEAADTEAGTLDPGERSASLPALLKTLADSREVLRIERGTGGWHTLPHDTYLDALVWADESAGLMWADLPDGTPRRLAPLPPNTLPLAVRSAQTLGLVVVASLKTIHVVEVGTGRIRAQVPFDERVTAIDVDEAGHALAVGTVSGVAILDLDRPTRTATVPVTEPRSGFAIGQVRFVPGSRRVLATYGSAILDFDRDIGAFTGPDAAKLTDAENGIGTDVVDALSGSGLVTAVTLWPDPRHGRLWLRSPLGLSAVERDGTVSPMPRGVGDTVLGITFTGPDAGGDAVAITAHRSDAGYDVATAYLPDGRDRPLVFDAFRVSTADLAGEQIETCRVGGGTAFLVCSVKGRTSQGLRVWQLLGGKHRRSRLAGTTTASGSAASLPASAGEADRLLVGSRDGLSILPARTAVAGVTWGPDWRLGARDGIFVPAEAPGRVQVLRVEPDGSIAVALPPMDGIGLAVKAEAGRVLVATGPDRLALVELATGRTLWTVPGLPGLRAIDLRTDGTEVLAATGEAAYRFDARTGRILASHPVAPLAGRPLELDADARTVVFVRADGLAALDAETGATAVLAPGLTGLGRVALALRHDRIVAATDDGRLLGLGRDGRERWSVPAPDGAAIEPAAAGAPPSRGTILALSVSPEGRIGVIRQDTPTLDILDGETGQYLTALSPFFRDGVAATASLEADGVAVTAWGLVAGLRDRPSSVSLHRLPLGPAEAAGAVRALRDALAVRGPDGASLRSDAANGGG